MTTPVVTRTTRISLVDLSGEATVAYTPLGVLYLKAALDTDDSVAGRLAVTVHAFLAGTSLARMATEIVAAAPDLIGLSCQGWNVALYRQLLPTLRQLLPTAIVVLGGNHVSHQGDRWLTQVPEVDIVVSGEGEHTIRDLARWLLAEQPDLREIPGITFRRKGQVVSTPQRPRVASMDEIPSAYLAIPALNGVDVALWETNRGCPYHCAFCYWGGAVGQKLSRAEFGRLTAELDTIGRAGIPAIFLCDANFGILPRDIELARMVVDTRRRFGAPTTLHVNWAKNHAERVGEILDILRDGQVHTNVYLALQTLSRPALKLAGRDERGRTEMMQLGRRIQDRGGEVGAELIFGMPGETLKDFRNAYDELFLQFPSLLLHPLWILPNTVYDTDRDSFDLITLRPDPTVDYEGVMSHNTLSREDNQAGLRLLLADEILVGTGYARTTIRGLARWAGIVPTEVLDSFVEFVATRSDPLSQQLIATFVEITAECYFHRRLRNAVRGALFADRGRAQSLLQGFVEAHVSDLAARDGCRELARYDTALLPRADLTGSGHVDEVVPVDFDTHAAEHALLSSTPPTVPPQRQPVGIHVQHEAGFARHRSDAIDFSARWRGRVIGVTPASEKPARE
ncbi:MAG: cobalamin-dependent protein [Pseudonocardiaceae bacterium]